MVYHKSAPCEYFFMIFRRKVQQGQKLGRKIGFQTANLSVGPLGGHYAFGVYAATVWIAKKSYVGALYFGPKSGSRQKAHLEIHLLNFRGNLYGKWIGFSVGQKIRDPIAFKNIEELKRQIKKDVSEIQKIIQ